MAVARAPGAFERDANVANEVVAVDAVAVAAVEAVLAHHCDEHRARSIAFRSAAPAVLLNGSRWNLSAAVCSSRNAPCFVMMSDAMDTAIAFS
jgi:hypothetical protein